MFVIKRPRLFILLRIYFLNFSGRLWTNLVFSLRIKFLIRQVNEKLLDGRKTDRQAVAMYFFKLIFAGEQKQVRILVAFYFIILINKEGDYGLNSVTLCM